PFLQTNANERNARFSPDGRWIAYTSDESGINEIYVQSFPALGSKQQISTNGGYFLGWSRHSNELFYVSSDKKMMAVDIKQQDGTIKTGTPKALFDVHVSSYTAAVTQFAVTGDGRKFLVASTVAETALGPIAVVLNWAADLKK